MKKKREKCVTHENYKLKIPLELHFKDSKIQNLFEKLKNSDCFEVQQQVITEVSYKIKSTYKKIIVLNVLAGDIF